MQTVQLDKAANGNGKYMEGSDMKDVKLTRRGFLKLSAPGAAAFFITGCGEGFLAGRQGGQKAIPFRTVELNKGESAEVVLSDGSRVSLRLLGVQHKRDSVCDAVRQVRAELEVNGRVVEVSSGNYNLPVKTGKYRIDCPITFGYYELSDKDRWGLDKHARFRLWPADGSLWGKGRFVYPVRQRWFATDTQMANEPCHVDAGEQPGPRKIYYHSGLDFGGAERLIEVVSATDGLVVCSGQQVLEGYNAEPVMPRYDVVYILDERGWYYRYSHLYEIDGAIRTGRRIKAGEKVGLLGKEGGSGGWSHLHFEIVSRQQSGRWGTQASYAFVWEAYIREYRPKVLAVARPHRLAKVGEEVVLDGSKSWCAGGELSYEWALSDGTRASGATVKKNYDEVGTYSEILKVSDSAGNTSYDFCKVQVFGGEDAEVVPPSIHLASWPTQDVKAGQAITFKVRSFTKEQIGETLDFGDGSKAVTVYSDGNRKMLAKDGYAAARHIYGKAGDYLVRAQCRDKAGHSATTRLHVRVSD